jgi:hypothetical protein
MNTSVVTEAPAVDPLAQMDLTPTVSVESSAPTTAVAVRPELPLVVLSTIQSPGSLINISQIPATEMAEINKLAGTIVLANESAVTMFGAEMQKQYSDALSNLLGQSTLGETGLYNFIAKDLQLSTEIVQEAIEKFNKKDGEVGFFRKALRSIPVVKNENLFILTCVSVKPIKVRSNNSCNLFV